MKGVDIVVGGNIGHMSAFMAQAGRLVVCGDAGDALGDSIYEARIYVKGAVASLGADCIEKPLRAEHLAELAELLTAAGRTDIPPTSNATDQPGTSTTSASTTRRRTSRTPHDHHLRPSTALRHRDAGRSPPRTLPSSVSANPPPSTGPPSRTSSAPPPPAFTTSAAGAPSARSRTSTTCCSWAPPCPATRWRATAKSAIPTSSSATGTPSRPLHLQTPVTIAGMSFGALSANAKEALGRGASEVGTSTTTGDGGMTPEERGQSKHLVYQYLPVPLRHEPR